MVVSPRASQAVDMVTLRIEHPVSDPQPQPLVGEHVSQPRPPRTRAVAKRQHREVQAQHQQPAGQRPRVPGSHSLIDDHTDQDRDERLTGLMAHQEQRRDADVTPVGADGGAQHRPPVIPRDLMPVTVSAAPACGRFSRRAESAVSGGRDGVQRRAGQAGQAAESGLARG